MESANKALLMAGGMLFAVMILSLVAYVFSNLARLPSEEDSEELVKQAAAFNNEYTAYDKKIMYGTDVISVLNKAKSNNEKYVLEKFVAGGGYNTDFIIDIEVVLKKPLQESMTVSYIAQTATSIAERDYYGTQEGPYKSGTNYYKASEIFEEPSVNYKSLIYKTKNWDNMDFITQTIDTNVEAGEYHLLGSDGEVPVPGSYTNTQLESNNKLKQLLDYSVQMTQTEKNRSGDTTSPKGWSQAVWKPAIYDLKTRKFKCIGDKVVYSDKTGRIIKMVFEEI